MQKKTLQEQIEQARKRLDDALASGNDMDNYYELSTEVDRMIERYIDFCEREKVKA